jgi:hypothetical protein
MGFLSGRPWMPTAEARVEGCLRDVLMASHCAWDPSIPPSGVNFK